MTTAACTMTMVLIVAGKADGPRLLEVRKSNPPCQSTTGTMLHRPSLASDPRQDGPATSASAHPIVAHPVAPNSVLNTNWGRCQANPTPASCITVRANVPRLKGSVSKVDAVDSSCPRSLQAGLQLFDL
jgi:hypothetical protein